MKKSICLVASLITLSNNMVEGAQLRNLNKENSNQKEAV